MISVIARAAYEATGFLHRYDTFVLIGISISMWSRTKKKSISDVGMILNHTLIYHITSTTRCTMSHQCFHCFNVYTQIILHKHIQIMCL
jgi:hypothetical protein